MRRRTFGVADALAEVARGILRAGCGEQGGAHYAIGFAAGLVHVYVVTDDLAEPFAAAYRGILCPEPPDAWSVTDGTVEGELMLARARTLDGQ